MQFFTWKEAVLAVNGRGTDLSVCRRVGEFRLPAIRYEMVPVCNGDGLNRFYRR